MEISALTVAAYLVVGVASGAWFWRIIRLSGHRVNLALVVVSAVFGGLWPVMMPGVTLYRFALGRPGRRPRDVPAAAQG
ncbi:MULTISPECIES: hypothetical protein [Mycobacteriaceae]|uniref:Uncharacterized protein n=1 Tax=Mycolicibacterium neoaurum VKM Ac-1815D TaxID=700508 RepID=V5XJ21_MYCNE|nr:MULTISPECIES: hypothetical protein [Mycobacteriaceae]AHC27908.1 hypothetical protein D174_10065 [Mycolicibacterium neoaurum VKM Ac-1815D]AMO05436.1 hypothetical protein MyAD_09860 [Mycolicibacterium neoaurum]AXK76247.1 hypothetical protein DXK33_15185 [Mycolicibacterium neoaurum]KJQ50720.1 hypothetical protein TS71_08910 [Mycolicibacterium neoaurum]KUM09906.1 hypothetical protein AVZ31_03430 [Mycolicibacterium neoaurum]